MRFYLILVLLFIYGCKTIQYLPPDEQTVKISLGYSCRKVDTFQNIFIFAFIPDTSAVDLWFTAQEQEIILNKADSINFYSYPDSLPREENGIIYRPYCYPAHLRIMTENKDKTVIFFRGTLKNYQSKFDNLIELASLILEMAFNKEEYKNYNRTNHYFHFDYFDDLK
jgi:hypothetical protein